MLDDLPVERSEEVSKNGADSELIFSERELIQSWCFAPTLKKTLFSADLFWDFNPGLDSKSKWMKKRRVKTGLTTHTEQIF